MGILVTLAFGLLMPYLPGKNGRRNMAESIGYLPATMLFLFIGFGIYIISYRVAINRHNKEIKRLKKG